LPLVLPIPTTITPPVKSLLFSGGYVQTQTSTNYTLGSGDFTAEFWANTSMIFNSESSTWVSLLSINDGTNNNNINLLAAGGYGGYGRGTITLIVSGVGIFRCSNYFSNQETAFLDMLIMKPNIWYHFAIVRTGSIIKVYLNGVSLYFSNITNSALYTEGLQLGSFNQTSTSIALNDSIFGVRAYNGYITNVRVVKGTAVYTSNFIIPTIPLSIFSNTVLLLNVLSPSGYLDDSSTYATNPTATGSVTYSAS